MHVYVHVSMCACARVCAYLYIVPRIGFIDAAESGTTLPSFNRPWEIGLEMPFAARLCKSSRAEREVGRGGSERSARTRGESLAARDISDKSLIASSDE